MFFEIFIQMMPYLAVFAVLGYIGRAQQKKAKEREEEQKKGIIRTCYVVKTEKILTIIFIIGIFFTGGLVVASVIQQEDFFPLFVFGIAFVVFLIGSLNMIMWKLEVNGDKIIWRSTFGKKMTFYFDDITYCETVRCISDIATELRRSQQGKDCTWNERNRSGCICICFNGKRAEEH